MRKWSVEVLVLEGTCTFVPPDEELALKAIERAIGEQLPRIRVEGYGVRRIWRWSCWRG